MKNKKSIAATVKKMLGILGFEIAPCIGLADFGNGLTKYFSFFHKSGRVAFCDCDAGFWWTSFASETTKAMDNICCGIRPIEIFNKLTSMLSFRLTDMNSYCYCTFKNPFYGCTSVEECLIRIDLRCGRPIDYSKLDWIHL